MSPFRLGSLFLTSFYSKDASPLWEKVFSILPSYQSFNLLNFAVECCYSWSLVFYFLFFFPPRSTQVVKFCGAKQIFTPGQTDRYLHPSEYALAVGRKCTLASKLEKLVWDIMKQATSLSLPVTSAEHFSLSEQHVVPRRLMSTQLLHLPRLSKSPP